MGNGCLYCSTFVLVYLSLSFLLSCGLIILRPRLPALSALLDNNGVSLGLGFCLHFQHNTICSCCFKTIWPRLAPNSLSRILATLSSVFPTSWGLESHVSSYRPPGTHTQGCLPGMWAFYQRSYKAQSSELVAPSHFAIENDFFWNYTGDLRKIEVPWGCLLQGQENFFGLLSQGVVASTFSPGWLLTQHSPILLNKRVEHLK